MQLVGGRSVEPTAADAQDGKSNYFAGNDPSKWKANVEGYSRVRYHDSLPGVDVVYHGSGQNRLEYDIELAPRLDPSQVKMAFDGVASLHIDAEGNAVLEVRGGGEILQPRPFAYQIEEDGTQESIIVRYQKRSNRELGFVVGPHDDTRTLVIDPQLLYSTYLGGTGYDEALSIAVDAAGNAYVAGETSSTDFPQIAAQGTYKGGYDAFVTKLNSSGTAAVYSTYLGGEGYDSAFSIAVNSAGNVDVAGVTASAQFPTKGCPSNLAPIQAANNGGYDAFVAGLDPSGAVTFSTYFGGSGDDQGNGIAVDPAGYVYVTGDTLSVYDGTANSAFPYTSTGLQPVNRGAADAFVVKLAPCNSAGQNVVYSTYLGGATWDEANGIAVDSAGNAYVTGITDSSDFPTASPFQAANHGGPAGDATDGFVSKLSPSGSALVYSTYLGGTDSDHLNGVAVDSSGNAYVTGYTYSTNFPIASPFQSMNRGGSDVVIAKLNPAGSALTYSTYLGGTNANNAADYAYGIVVDSTGNAFVVGSTSSTDFPAIAPLQSINRGGPAGQAFDGFVANIRSTGTILFYSTYLGGTGVDWVNGVAVDAAGGAFVVGGTTSTSFPLAPSPFQGTNKGNTDAFVSKLSPVTVVPVPALPFKLNVMLAAILVFVGLTQIAKRLQLKSGASTQG